MATFDGNAGRHDLLRCVGLAITAAAVALGAAGCSPKTSSVNSADGQLRVGVIPFDKASVIQEKYTPLAAYLAKRRGVRAGKSSSPRSTPACCRRCARIKSIARI